MLQHIIWRLRIFLAKLIIMHIITNKLQGRSVSYRKGFAPPLHTLAAPSYLTPSPHASSAVATVALDSQAAAGGLEDRVSVSQRRRIRPLQGGSETAPLAQSVRFLRRPRDVWLLLGGSCSTANTAVCTLVPSIVLSSPRRSMHGLRGESWTHVFFKVRQVL
jgi:hypothetical protein